MTLLTGKTHQIGKTQMNSRIVDTLEMMCDMDNPQDRKLLLLAELVETKCDALADNQKALIKNLEETKTTLSETGEKLEKLTRMLEDRSAETHSCPVHKNKEGFEKISTFLRYPKITMFTIIGVIAMLAGILGTRAFDLLKFIFGF